MPRSGNFSLYEDVAGKPGWMASIGHGMGRVVTSVLRFRLKFGNSTKLSIEYVPYEGLPCCEQYGSVAQPGE